MIRKEIQHAELVQDDDGIIKLVLDHDKGRTVLGLPVMNTGIGFLPMDDSSRQALADLGREMS